MLSESLSQQRHANFLAHFPIVHALCILDFVKAFMVATKFFKQDIKNYSLFFRTHIKFIALLRVASMYPKYKFRKLFHALLLSTIVCVLYLQILKSTQNSSAAMSNNYAAEEEILKGSLQQKIVIGLVVCGITDEAVTLLKSVLISAKASHVEEIEFHIITEDWLVTAALKQKVKQYQLEYKLLILKLIHFNLI